MMEPLRSPPTQLAAAWRHSAEVQTDVSSNEDTTSSRVQQALIQLCLSSRCALHDARIADMRLLKDVEATIRRFADHYRLARGVVEDDAMRSKRYLCELEERHFQHMLRSFEQWALVAQHQQERRTIAAATWKLRSELA